MEPAATPGDRVGRYVIEALLGEGGMGHVYRAHDELLHRKVALKLLRTEAVAGESVGSAPTVARVLREARMAAAFDHPNVVGIFDMGEDRGRAFIVMEHVTGRSLRAIVNEGGTPPDEKVRILVDVARALAAAHRAGLVHRDVKPENVMVRDDGVVKVLDFGIARRAGSSAVSPLELASVPFAELAKTLGDTMATQEGRVVGTPAYIAPEMVARGQSDARSDQFAWGVLAYEMLVGRLPWRDLSSPVDVLVCVVRDPIPPLSAADLGVDASIVAAVHRALEKDPARRFGSMDELLASIAPTPSDVRRPGATIRPAGATPSGPTDPTLTPADLDFSARSLVEISGSPISSTLRAYVPRRGKRSLGWIAAAVAVLASVGVGARVLRRAPAVSFAPTNVRRLTFAAGCEEYPALLPGGRELLFDGAKGDDYHVFSLDLASGVAHEVTHGAGWQFAATPSPDGRTIAYLATSGDERVSYVAPLDGSSPPRRLAAGWVRPAWSPDGSAVWGGAAEVGATRFDARTFAPGRTLRTPIGEHLSNLLELRDGRVVATSFDRTGEHGAGLYVYPSSGGDGRLLWRGRVEEAILEAPDGKHVLFARETPAGKFELWSIGLDGSDPAPVAGAGADVAPTKGLALGPDRGVAYWSTCDTRTQIAGLVREGTATLRSREVFPESPWRDTNPTAIPGTSLLVVLSDRARRGQPWILDRASQSPPRAVTQDLSDVESIAVSPDGRTLVAALAKGGLRALPIDGSAPPRELTRGDFDAFPTFSIDGSVVYFETILPGGERRVAEVPLAGGAPKIVVDAPSGRPGASPAVPVLVYVAFDGRGGADGRPMLLDLATRTSKPLGPSLPIARWSAARFSSDGARIAISPTTTEIVELDTKTAEVRGRFATGGDEVFGYTYAGDDLVFARLVWSGDVWVGERPFR